LFGQKRICKSLSWTYYITSIAKSTSMKIGSLFRVCAHLTNKAIMYIYKSVTRPSMELLPHMGCAPSSTFSMFDKILSLLYKYVHGHYSSKLSELIPPLKTFFRNTRLSTKSHPLTVVLPKCNRKFYQESFNLSY